MSEPKAVGYVSPQRRIEELEAFVRKLVEADEACLGSADFYRLMLAITDEARGVLSGKAAHAVDDPGTLRPPDVIYTLPDGDTCLEWGRASGTIFRIMIESKTRGTHMTTYADPGRPAEHGEWQAPFRDDETAGGGDVGALLREAAATIRGLAEQQAMSDDWYRATLEKIEAAVEGKAS